ncbi:MAG: DNA gyrase subunit B [Planctomycetia bacterium]|nr:DNA gyrase subunit B [Planctomycetia bacterium]
MSDDPNNVQNENQNLDPDSVASAYGAEQISHLSDLEHVRMRPGMYIGDTTLRGLHHLVYEVVDNSIDEAMAGHATYINVLINEDGSITVEDNGRGIPVEMFPELGISTLEGVMTVLKFGGKFGDGAYTTSGGLHGVGVTVVNFLSEWCTCEVSRDGQVWRQEYERGVPITPVKCVGKTEKRGTRTIFKPDGEIFPDVKFSYSTLYRRLQELAFLNSGVRIKFKDLRTGDGDTFYYERGLEEFVESLNRAAEPIHPDVIQIRGQSGDTQLHIALQYTGEYTENVHSYVNNINTIEGGTHVSGFRSALTRSLNQYGKKENIFDKIVPAGDDWREGLTAVISVRVANPQFEGQTKTKLGNSEVESFVSSLVYEALTQYFEENPKNAKLIAQKGIVSARAREAAKKARELVRERKDALSSGGMPGKLRDCSSKEVEKCELYLVEGNSAGGTAEGGRMREFQAILPLRGKIINAYKAREDRVLANEEVRTMISAIGTGIGEAINLEKRRYNKIIIMTDADVDGSHIRTLLLTFFYRQMYDLVKAGYVYVAQPPLFRIIQKKKTSYVQTDEEMNALLLQNGMNDSIFDPKDGRLFEGEELLKLAKVLSTLEDSINTLERRGISLKSHAMRQDPVSGRMPTLNAFFEQQEHWFFDHEQVEQFVEKYRSEHGGKVEIVDATALKIGENEGENEGKESELDESIKRIVVMEIHEVRSINKQLRLLRELGFELDSLIPQIRTGQQGNRYELRCGENVTGLEDLRGLLPAIRAIGERGMVVTRFKGLGEMNAEEIRETTLDPERRTMVQVRLDDAGAAAELFQILMGEKVEPRREFIEKYALDVVNLDV